MSMTFLVVFLLALNQHGKMDGNENWMLQFSSTGLGPTNMCPPNLVLIDIKATTRSNKKTAKQH